MKKHAPYPRPDTMLVKSLYHALRAGDFDRRVWRACMAAVLVSPQRTGGEDADRG